MRQLKYFAAFTLPIVTFAALWWPQYLCFATVVYAFGIVPIIEVLVSPRPANLSEAEEEKAASGRIYDMMLYAMVPAQYGLFSLLLYRAAFDPPPLLQLIGMTASMGVHCGAVGINVAHELGHRVSRFERFLAQSLLLTAMYMHFTIEHNRGHHKAVGTLGDPATARRNESLYRFWVRGIPSMMASAWRIECAELRKAGHRIFGPGNRMLQLLCVEAAVLVLIYTYLGPLSLACFLGAAGVGILVLESVNYIEHYGLLRREVAPGKFERVQPHHSWNSDHLLGRIMLFELTRHADHHYSASRRYQILRHMPEGPQLPLGYPASMLMALLPPLWFRVIHPTLDQVASGENDSPA